MMSTIVQCHHNHPYTPQHFISMFFYTFFLSLLNDYILSDYVPTHDHPLTQMQLGTATMIQPQAPTE